jgi:threonine dehydrogenase-like Zn-dependent dehydrogenase
VGKIENTMRALVFNGKELKYFTDYPIPQLKKNEALIRVKRAGICNTDIEITKGYMGFQGILGHEFVGVVEKCSEKDVVGKRVVGEINIGCGRCPYCMNQMQRHCPNRIVLGILNKDGAFAEYVTLPVSNLHEIPDTISDDEAVFVEPLAAAFEILEQITILPSNRVCILGDGKLGLLVAQVISTKECDLIVIGNHREKLSILDEMGIETRLSSEFRGKEFDIVIDCTGARSGIETALNIVKPTGTVVVKTTMAKKCQIDLNRLVVNELKFIGSRCGPFIPAIKAIEARQVDLYSLMTMTFPLEEGVKAFKYAKDSGALKVILTVM